jgi:hypothetical protein
MNMPASTVRPSRSHTGSPSFTPMSELLAQHVPVLFPTVPGAAVRREPHIELGYDDSTGEYHLSITAPLRTL